MLAVAAMAAPTVLDQKSSTSSLARRKNTNKGEAHIHIDSSNGLCGNSCTTKYNIDFFDNFVPAQLMGKDWYRANIGTWSASNPDYQIKIGTTRGLDSWIDGSIPGGIPNDSWRNFFTLHYGSQHWKSHEREDWKYKGSRPSNGHRHEFDLWCEFDC